MALAYYGAEISPNMTRTPEGYLICRNVPINRTGAQQYLARDLMLDGDPERIVTVNRHPEDVFEAAAIASFEGKDVTEGHPPENLTAQTQAAYSKGHVQNVRRVGENTVADLIIKDPQLASEVESGMLREVSCGYMCHYEPDGAGYRQTKIRGNHVAVVPRGRAGHDVAIKDAAPEAEKGRRNMSKFANAILTAFGMAAQDASPEELKDMVDTTSKALEAAPAEAKKDAAPEAAPAKEAQKGADVMVERAPKGDDLGSKLDELIAMVRELGKKNDREEKKLSDEDDLDEMIAKLAGREKHHGDPEEAVTVPAEEMEEDACDPATRDAALSLLRKVRPAVASIQNKSERARVVDALLATVKGPDMVGDIMKATQDSARKNSDASRRSTYERVCADSETAYAARNPHKAKKED